MYNGHSTAYNSFAVLNRGTGTGDDDGPKRLECSTYMGRSDGRPAGPIRKADTTVSQFLPPYAAPYVGSSKDRGYLELAWCFLSRALSNIGLGERGTFVGANRYAARR